MEESKVLQVESIRSRVFRFLSNKPNANIHEIYDKFPYYKHETLQVYKAQFRREYVDHVKNVIIIVLDVLNHKAILNTQLSRTEEDAIKDAEIWSGYNEYKQSRIAREVEKRRRSRRT